MGEIIGKENNSNNILFYIENCLSVARLPFSPLQSISCLEYDMLVQDHV